MKNLTLVVIALTSLAGCGGDDPVSFSAPIAINLKVESGDVKAGNAVSNDKNITTESGNPWAKFITDARAKLTKDPADVDLDKLELLLAATSTGVAAFEEIFTGEVVIQFRFESSSNVIPVAKITNPTGRGPVSMSIQFDFAAITPQDLPAFFNGSYKVVLAGTANPTYQARGAKADIQATFQFSAFE